MERRLRTPLEPEISFSDDPLRMLRAARFVATLDLGVEPAVEKAVMDMRSRMEIVSVERVRDEIQKVLLLPSSQPAFAFLSRTGLLRDVLPAVASEQHDPAKVGERVGRVDRSAAPRWAALLLDAPARLRAGELRRLKPSGALASEVQWLTETESWFTAGVPSDARSLRRLAAAAPSGLRLESRLEFVAALRDTHNADLIEAGRVLEELRDAEPDLDDPKAPLSGSEIAERLRIEPGPLVGEALKALREQRFDHGPLNAEQARRFVDDWWRSHH